MDGNDGRKESADPFVRHPILSSLGWPTSSRGELTFRVKLGFTPTSFEVDKST